jgi:hypothetical protein
MFKPLLFASAAVALILAACTPPEPVPPPRFKPNPPYPPQQVDPYGQPVEPYNGQPDVAPLDNPAPPPTQPGEYPTARATAKPGEVVSPYEPYNTIDVSGFTSGQLARDPSNRKIFRVP